MGVLDKISQMRKQGLKEKDIIKNLKEDGVSPRAIDDAMNNEQIKKAVSDEYGSENEYIPSPSSQQNQGDYSTTQEVSQNEDYYTPQESTGEYYSPGNYQYSDYSYPSETITPSSSNTIIEIAEQVFSDKIQKIQKQIEEINEFKAITETKIENISERLKKVESIIDKLQISILERVGSYGQNLDSIKREMSMMQDTFSKFANKNSTQKSYSQSSTNYSNPQDQKESSDQKRVNRR
ncbi:hypothetical protein J4407_02300 [Candidatus Pacearchaeota archaeon]|nr:hypothetical protein [Candidatus Pacearchaeota archaeon]